MILARMPSSTASTSIVALSVSISARTSPDFTLSPTALTHLAILPSVMVGDRAGIRISTGIFLPGLSGQVRRWSLVVRLERVLVGHVAVEQALLRLVDAIVLDAHAIDLVLGAVFGRVGHRVAAIAIGQHLENIRSIAGTRMP